MKVAFPIQRGRISPVFDSCGRLLLVEDRKGAGRVREEVSLAGLDRFERAPRLKDLGVDVLVCGGLSPWVASQVESLGIGLIPWVAGPVEEVVDAFFLGRLPSRAFTMPGCRWAGGRRGRGGGHRRGRGRGGSWGPSISRGPAW